jgi:hypothetical protein
VGWSSVGDVILKTWFFEMGDVDIRRPQDERNSRRSIERTGGLAIRTAGSLGFDLLND